MSDRFRRYAELFGVAAAAAILTMAGPAVARTIADFAENSDKVDGKHAVGSSSTIAARKGKLVATSRKTGRLPNNIIKKAPDAARLGGKRPRAYALKTQVAALQARVAKLEAKLQKVSFDPVSKVLLIEGANLQIVDGTGETGDIPNGLGNLIVGYNEDVFFDGTDTRNGSHNVVIGAEHTYTSFGGIVVGFDNAITNKFASVTGGQVNRATGPSASVSGGGGNIASGANSSISGGGGNRASEADSSVSGGNTNTASAPFSSVSGGAFNTAGSLQQWVAGTLIARTATVSVPGGAAGNGTYDTAGTQILCAAGEQLLGGGATWDSEDTDDLQLPIIVSREIESGGQQGWKARGGNDTSTAHTLTVQALCYGP
jgi:hypothetical protein